MKYPYKTKRDGDEILISFPDVPEALTSATRETADSETLDALVTALVGYELDGKKWPKASPIQTGKPFVRIPTLLTAKIALIGGLHRSGKTQADLASLLNIDPRAVRRLLNLNHRSHVEEVERALDVLNFALEIRRVAA
jgi:antitoxin HicB